MTTNSLTRRSTGRKALAMGFSLIELMVAMAVFLVVSATSFTLFSRHEALLSQEQGIAGLNIGLRSALAQLQIDVVNAGNGQIQGANVPAWPVGITVINSNPNANPPCNPSPGNPSYSVNCFDQVNIVMVDPSTPPLHPQNACGGAYDTTSGAPFYGTVPINPATGQPVVPVATVAGNFVTGDPILFVTANGTKFTTAVLTAPGSVPAAPAGTVQLTFNPTLSAGSPPPPWLGMNSAWPVGNPHYTPPGITGPNDPLGISTYTTPPPPLPPGSPAAAPPYLTNSFCSSDWVLRLVPITYSVINTATANGYQDPQLLRTQGNPPVQNVLMDQVIGFKVGVAWWNNDVSTFPYDYNSSDYYNQFTLVRSVRVTLIGRTAPSTDPTYTYRNPFDSGPYQIRGSSIVVDPRNLTMNND